MPLSRAPWRVATHHGQTVIFSEDYVVADIWTGSYQGDGTANARLIAEAPAMAEALEAFALPALVHMSLTAHAGDRETFRDRAAAVRAILSRINGEG